MAINLDTYEYIIKKLATANATLVAVSKTKPIKDIEALYQIGHRDFGENYVQELIDKQLILPKDIQWHFIGHLQSNKVKYIAPFVHLIHGVDSYKLLQEIDKQATKIGRTIDCLLQVHIAQEETKFGFNEAELQQLFASNLQALTHIRIKGMMGMASFTEDAEKIRGEFKTLKRLFDIYSQLEFRNCTLSILSMGMSSDYKIAIEEGSNMVRIGSLLFGSRK
ncbi:YggS family pyridoxal phosphate-dependent enzyme [Parasediminibacterium sp. JCM 36343]|uniref:YggS family pyridoxal phosphate-dependent enzyme n=1 Tax=Parasediminibacterium sp. JCM 36343 TaxID=3374279 RepID=UPI00397C6EB0